MLTIEELPEECPECGGTDLTWGCAKRSGGSVVDGRLRIHDVIVEFFLGCDDCSETVFVASADDVADFLTTERR